MRAAILFALLALSAMALVRVVALRFADEQLSERGLSWSARDATIARAAWHGVQRPGLSIQTLSVQPLRLLAHAKGVDIDLSTMSAGFRHS
ncbi:MAG: hypothetical protein AAFV53_39130, partial [Myxococcota bacterium]